jgi:hypothetical protein
MLRTMTQGSVGQSAKKSEKNVAQKKRLLYDSQKKICIVENCVHIFVKQTFKTIVMHGAENIQHTSLEYSTDDLWNIIREDRRWNPRTIAHLCCEAKPITSCLEDQLSNFFDEFGEEITQFIMHRMERFYHQNEKDIWKMMSDIIANNRNHILDI